MNRLDEYLRLLRGSSALMALLPLDACAGLPMMLDRHTLLLPFYRVSQAHGEVIIHAPVAVVKAGYPDGVILSYRALPQRPPLLAMAGDQAVKHRAFIREYLDQLELCLHAEPSVQPDALRQMLLSGASYLRPYYQEEP